MVQENNRAFNANKELAKTFRLYHVVPTVPPLPPTPPAVIKFAISI